jgi:hypothetical protein
MTMMRNLRHVLSTSLVLLVTGLQFAVAGCSDTPKCDTSDCGGGPDTCKLDPPGETFTFHVHNGGTAMLRLTFGCSDALPIDIDTPDGALAIGAGSVNTCEVKCDSVYAGTPNPGCSDCGPGIGADLAPGMTVDIQWDRRVYVAHMADVECSGSEGGNDCALGQAVAPSATQKGVLTVCSEDMYGGGYCTSGMESAVPFTIDTTKNEGTIEVM